MFYAEGYETLPREDLKKLQLMRLQDLVNRTYSNVLFYRSRFDERNFRPEHLQSLTDLKYLPFTEKQDLRNHFPYGLLALPRENLVRIHASSGTTGKSTVVGYSRRDVKNWAALMARALAAAGVTPRDIVHNAYGYGLFTGGLGVHYGVDRKSVV